MLERLYETERWINVPISGYEQYYQISTLGRLRSVERTIIDLNWYNRTRIYKQYLVKSKMYTNYLQVCLCVNGNRKYIHVHKLVALTFVPNPLNKPQVNHKNGIKIDNYYRNLEWVTAKENIRHSFDILNHKGSNLGKTRINAVCNKKVGQYSKNNEFIESYYSLNYASEITGIDGTSICKALKGVINTAGGYIWKYENKNT